MSCTVPQLHAVLSPTLAAQFCRCIACPLLCFCLAPRRYEELAIPLRVAFPRTFVFQPVIIAIDVVVDAIELAAMWGTWRFEAPQRTASTSTDKAAKATLSPRVAARDALVIVLLHAGRILYIFAGTPYLWFFSQVVRIQRVLELLRYIDEMSADLSTNVTFLAVFKVRACHVPHAKRKDNAD